MAPPSAPRPSPLPPKSLLAALLVALLGGAPLPAHAQDGGTPKGRPAAGRKSTVDLGGLRLPSLGAVPKADGVKAPTASPASALPQGTRTLGGERYSVLEVVHAAGFTEAASGPRPVGPRLQAVSLEGSPPQTPRFSTLLRLRSPSRTGAAIEVALLDAGGETVMGTSGTLAFGQGEQTTFQVDWEPTHLRRAGTYQVLVRVAGEPLGTWPLEVRGAR